MNNLLRELNQDSIRLLQNGKERIVSISAIRQQYNIDGVIRIHENEYTNIHEDRLAHFNLQICHHEVGKIYALPKIIKSGFYKPSTGEEQLPLLSFEDIYIGTCIQVQEEISYQDLTQTHFNYSMNHIDSVEALQEAIWKRYHQSLPELSRKSMMELGVSWTLLDVHR